MKPPLTIKPFLATASGRVNLIGEHTDYNGGYVLPTAIPQVTQVELWPRDDSHVRIESTGFPSADSIFEYDLGHELRRGRWPDYIQGVTHVLLSEKIPLSGFEARITSQVPMGSGLSSSAALEVSLLKAIRAAFGLSLNDIQIAQIGQKAENTFVGARVGIMDQMAASLAQQGQALFLDTRDLRFKHIPLPLNKIDLLVIHSGVIHSNAYGDGYNERRSQCELASRILGVGQLRELELKHLPQIGDRLPELLFRRVRHVVTENERVLLAVQAIEKSDIAALGQLFYQSHISMRDDYQVSIPEIDLLVELALVEKDVLGARLTGGGFGGSVVLLTQPGKARTIGENLSELYRQRSGKLPQILIPASLS